jgi:heat shock protein HtpX
MNVVRRGDFGKDTGLQTRMVITMFLLGLLYVVLIAVAVTAGVGILGVVALFAVLCAAQLFAADKIALRATGAHEISPGDAPELQAIIDRLCVQANIPRPRVALVDSPMPNAFALGRSQKTATVCVTTGLLSTLSHEQLEGVIAHELTHVINRDVMVMTLASFFASVAALLVRYGLLFGRRGRSETQAAVGVVILVSVAVYVISFMLLRALSRYREYAADRGAAVLTGRPSALASALLALNDRMGTIPTKDLRTAAQMNAFFIIPARQKAWVMRFFATHPPIEKRIAALARYEEQLQR